MKVVVAPEASEEFASALGFLRERNPQAAEALATRIRDTILSLSEGAFDGPERALRRTGKKVRSWPVRPYRIYYRREGEVMMVLRIRHAARRPIAR